MSDSYSNYTDDEVEETDEELDDDEDTHGNTSIRLFDSVEEASKHALETGEYKEATAADGQQYWYNTVTKATTWNLKRELADRVKPSIGGDNDSVASLGLGLSVSTSSLMKRREDRRIKEEVQERERALLQQQQEQEQEQEEEEVEKLQEDDTIIGEPEEDQTKVQLTSISNVSPIRAEDTRQSKQPTPQSAAASPRPVKSKAGQRQKLLAAAESNNPAHSQPKGATALELSDFSDISEFVENPALGAPRGSSKRELRSFGSVFGEKVPTPKSSTASRMTSSHVTPRQSFRESPVDRMRAGGIYVEAKHEEIPKQPSPPAARRASGGARKGEHIPLLPTQHANAASTSSDAVPQSSVQQQDIISQLMMAYLDLKNSSAQQSLKRLDSELQSIKDTPGSRVTEQMFKNSIHESTSNSYGGHNSLNRQIEEEVLNLVLQMMGTENRSQSQATAEGTNFSRMLLNGTAKTARRSRTHVVQKLNETDAVPNLPEFVKSSGHQVSFSDTTAAELEMVFKEKDSLHQLCLKNLNKYIIDRLRHTNKLSHVALLQVLISDLVYCLTQVVQNQGAKNYPTATYFIKYYKRRMQNESIMTTYISTILHCLPYESVAKGHEGGEVLNFRQEYWVTKSHVIECILALQQTQHRLEYESIGMQKGTEPDVSSLICRDNCLHLSIHSPEQTDELLIAGGPTAASLLSETPQNPMSSHVIDALISDLKLEAFSSTNSHLSTQVCSTYLNKTIHEILLDNVVKKGIISKTLKAMGITKTHPTDDTSISK